MIREVEYHQYIIEVMVCCCIGIDMTVLVKSPAAIKTINDCKYRHKLGLVRRNTALH